MGDTNHEFINRAALGREPGPEEHDPRNDVLTSAKRAEERKHCQVRRHLRGCTVANPMIFGMSYKLERSTRPAKGRRASGPSGEHPASERARRGPQAAGRRSRRARRRVHQACTPGPG